MKTILCVRDDFTDYEPSENFSFTGRWKVGTNYEYTQPSVEFEVCVVKTFMGMVYKRKTHWVDSEKFIDVNICGK